MVPPAGLIILIRDIAELVGDVLSWWSYVDDGVFSSAFEFVYPLSTVSERLVQAKRRLNPDEAVSECMWTAKQTRD